MGKSTNVSYNFGQLGSVYSQGDVIKPPSGKVFVAIQMLEDLRFDKLQSETYTSSSGVSKTMFIDGVRSSHGTGDHEDTGTHNDDVGDDDRVITVATASASIKKGMIVEHADMCPSSLTDPYRVVSVNGADITLNKSVAADKAAGSGDKTQFYWERSQGFGGQSPTMDSSGFVFPAGLVLFGRYTEIEPDGTGRLIAYIGE